MKSVVSEAIAVGLRIDKYELTSKIGEGGFGVVFVARDHRLERDVALKFLLPEHQSNPEVMNRFLQEARAVAKIVHPGIVTVYECAEVAGTRTPADGTAYIAMELLDGDSLSDRLAEVGRIPPAFATEICRQVASALDAAHRVGVVHRDLKPENILLVRDPIVPGGHRAKVLDFGIAKLVGREAGSSVRTHTMMVFGTPAYMSPEQCKSTANVDVRSDIYSLGCILFELVAGRPPFVGEGGELMAHHLLTAPPRLSSLAPSVSPDLDATVAKMLAKDPRDRFVSMSDVERALQAETSTSAALVWNAPTVRAGSHLGQPRSPGSGPDLGRPVVTTLGSAAGSTLREEPRSTVSRWWLAAPAVAAVAFGAVMLARTAGSPASQPAVQPIGHEAAGISVTPIVEPTVNAPPGEVIAPPAHVAAEPPVQTPVAPAINPPEHRPRASSAGSSRPVVKPAAAAPVRPAPRGGIVDPFATVPATKKPAIAASVVQPVEPKQPEPKPIEAKQVEAKQPEPKGSAAPACEGRSCAILDGKF